MDEEATKILNEWNDKFYFWTAHGAEKQYKLEELVGSISSTAEKKNNLNCVTESRENVVSGQSNMSNLFTLYADLYCKGNQGLTWSKYNHFTGAQ